MAAQRQPWSFNGDGVPFRLQTEAHRIRLGTCSTVWIEFCDQGSPPAQPRSGRYPEKVVMEPNDQRTDAEKVVGNTTAVQLRHFETDSRCRGLQLPDGLLLRYTLSTALFFYLRTGVDNGKLVTRAFASDTPYDWQKAPLGELVTPMFEEDADGRHLEKVERLLRTWIEFVTPNADAARPFAAFATGQNRS